MSEVFQLKRILLPVDFSPLSVIAAASAAAIARQFEATITVLHVDEFLLHPPSGGPFGIAHFWESVRSEQVSEKHKQLDGFAGPELDGLEVTRAVCSGDPATVIVERAHGEASDLILMPTHGCGPFRRFLLGSVTAKVLHDSDCPVWTGAHLADVPTRLASNIRHVMCAVDLGPGSSRCANWAAGFAARWGAKLTLLHVLEHRSGSEAGSCPAAEECEGKEQLHKLVLEVQAADSLLVTDGEVPVMISKAVTERRAELLVIGRTRAARGARLRPNLYATICNTDCPVVSV